MISPFPKSFVVFLVNVTIPVEESNTKEKDEEHIAGEHPLFPSTLLFLLDIIAAVAVAVAVAVDVDVDVAIIFIIFIHGATCRH